MNVCSVLVTARTKQMHEWGCQCCFEVGSNIQ